MKRSKQFLKMLLVVCVALGVSYAVSFAQENGPSSANPDGGNKLGPCGDKTSNVVILKDDDICIKADGSSTRFPTRNVHRDSSGKVVSITYDCPPGYDKKKVTDATMACEVGKKMEGMPAACVGSCDKAGEVCTDKGVTQSEKKDDATGSCEVNSTRTCKCEKPAGGGSGG